MQKTPSLQFQFQTDSPRLHPKRSSHIQSIRKSFQMLPTLNLKKSKLSTRPSFQENCQSSDSPDQPLSLYSNFYTRSSLFCQGFEDKYQLLQKLGQGSSGVVHRCRKIKTQQQFAVKSFTFEDQHLPWMRSCFMVMKRLEHPHIASYEALYIDTLKRMGWLVMEYVTAPSLHKADLKDQDQVREIMQQLLETLNYLHKSEISHRDIKLENVLYDQKNRQIKLIDFGVCRRFKKRGALFDMWTITGTLYYRAPQMFLGGGYRQKVDIWAAGVLLYKLIAKKTPFQSVYHSSTVNNIIKKEVDFTPAFNKYSVSLRALILRMLKKDPQERMSAIACLKDVWFFSIPSHLHIHIGSMPSIADVDQVCQIDYSKKSDVIKNFHSFECTNFQKYQCIQSLSPQQEKTKAIKYKEIAQI